MWDNSWDGSDFSDLVGKVITKIVHIDDDQIDFFCEDGNEYRMLHHQDCCESVGIKDICGNLEDLVGEKILLAEATSNQEDDEEYGDSTTWTFYKLGSNGGHVDISWVGSSNGYYSESVNFEKKIITVH